MMILNTFSNLLSYRRPLELRDITGPVSSKIYSTRLFYNGHLQAGSIIVPFWNHSNEITRENGGSMGSMCTSQNHQRNKAKGSGTVVRLQATHATFTRVIKIGRPGLLRAEISILSSMSLLFVLLFSLFLQSV